VDFLNEMLVRIAGGLVAAELYRNLPLISIWLVERAAAQMPARLRERYGEEWLAYLNDCDGNIRKLFSALGFVWSTKKLLDQWHAERDPIDRGDMRLAHELWLVTRFAFWCARAHPLGRLQLQFAYFISEIEFGDLRKAREASVQVTQAIRKPYGQSDIERLAGKRLRIARIARAATRAWQKSRRK